MSRTLNVLLALCTLQLLACGADKDEETGAADGTDGTDGAPQPALQPKSGDWDIVTSGWSDDNCNAEAAFTDLVTVTFSEIDAFSFSMTLYEANLTRVGNTITCTHAGDDVFACEDFFNDVAISGIDATVNVVGIPTVTLNSTTSAAGQGDLTVDCTGTDCDMLTGGNPFTGFPCTATNNWTATPQ